MKDGIVWLASYPKSGNTWFRMLIANVSAKDGIPVDINDLPERGGIASARGPFEYLTLLDSGLLTPDEADCLRPRVYEDLAMGAEDDVPAKDAPEETGPRFIKVHDAYTHTPQGEPMLAAARAAILIVRDPRDVAISLAHHLGRSIDDAIAMMGDRTSAFSQTRNRLAGQLRQKLHGWSGHVTSWLGQTEVPLHLVRYEDLKVATETIFLQAMAFAGRAISAAQAQQAARLADFENLKRQEQERGFKESPSGTAFFREGQAGRWRAVLSIEQVRRIEDDHADVMRRLGYALH